MFSESYQKIIITPQSIDDVNACIMESLSPIGTVKVTKSGVIKIDAYRLNSVLYEVCFDASVRQKGDSYWLNIQVNYRLSGLMLFMIFFFIGLPLLIVPYSEKNRLYRKLETILNEIVTDLKHPKITFVNQ